jgi:hypothetical protein
MPEDTECPHDRYQVTHYWAERPFKLNIPNLQEDECRFLIMKVVEQAVRDYLALEGSTAPIEQYHYSTAQAFIFDDEYILNYGEQDVSPQDMLGVLDIDIQWFRDRVEKLKRLRVKQVSLNLESKAGRQDES